MKILRKPESGGAAHYVRSTTGYRAGKPLACFGVESHVA